ncbi:phospholipase D family protein [Polaromonas sp.]|uniref:phospholipase D family nuclease n=1 Tax=Polaromonas sp. TaxID=1869339 RepID=UPI003455B1AE
MGCAVQSQSGSNTSNIEVAFSPEGGSEALILKVIGAARRSVRIAAYSFTSPAVVRSLMDAKRRGVDVKVLVDDRGNRSQSSIAAMSLLAGAEIPLRVISAYAIHHDKYIVVDERHVQTGSFNYSRAAANTNSENVIAIWDNPAIAVKYLDHWENRWEQGRTFDQKY